MSGKGRFIDRFDVVLLDMGGTFMFNTDRFADAGMVHATYRGFGGRALGAEELGRLARDFVGHMWRVYDGGAHDEDFPTILEHLRAYPGAADFSAEELRALDESIAVRECGTVPGKYARVLWDLQATHRLGLISNVWSKRDSFVREFERVGIAELFDVLVFSSDLRINKPSPKIFRAALDQLGVPADCAVYIGDTYDRDVEGAKGAGMASVWINPKGLAPVRAAQPDLVIETLGKLLDR